MQDGLSVRGCAIPGDELEWRFTTSGGPGGQHANRSSTAVELRFNLARSTSLPERLVQRAMRRLAAQVTADGWLIVTAQGTRSQTRNRAEAVRRLRDLLEEATAPPARPRVPTRPSRGARRRRLDDKARRGDVKRLRRPPES